jgi:hypothetical protein
MACRRAFDVDLVACLLDAERPEWSEFREHYPRCPECAAEVRTWTELQANLAPQHPGPEDLARFESRANDLPPEARKAIAAHIATCRSCRDELRALRAFDPRALPAGGEPAVAPRRRRWWRPVGRLVLHPASAFAYGLAVALAFPVVAPRLRPLVERGSDVWHVRAVAPVATQPVARPPATAPPLAESPPLATVANTAARHDPGASSVVRALEAEGGRRDVPPAAPVEMHAMAKNAAAPAHAREEAAASDEWPVVVLTPDREVVVHAPTHGLVLRLAPPRSQPALPTGLAWLRVRDEAGRREMREQQFGTPGSSAEIRVPAAWLEPGSYRAAIVTGDDNRPVTVARFRVES